MTFGIRNPSAVIVASTTNSDRFWPQDQGLRARPASVVVLTDVIPLSTVMAGLVPGMTDGEVVETIGPYLVEVVQRAKIIIPLVYR
jgi:hypothetical protein